MNQEQIFEKVITILTPFARAPDALANAAMNTSILGELKVNSARLVDVVLEMEDAFGLAISDEEADAVQTVGDAVNLVLKHKA